jgi:type IV secretory pathway TrbF-like protein
MEAAKKDEKENASWEEKKGKRTWVSRINTFMAMGGIILVFVAIAAILIIIGTLTK